MILAHQRNQLPTDKNFIGLRNVDRLYAYLQVLSDWDFEPGTPRYVLKENFSATEASEELSCTRQTIYNRLDKLKSNSYVVEKDDRFDLIINDLYTTVNPDTLKYLYQFKLDGLITAFAFLRAMSNFFEQKKKSFFFTESHLIQHALGLSSNGKSYEKVRVILDILTKLDLIKLRTRSKTNNYGKEYLIYEVIYVHDEIKLEEYETIPDDIEIPNVDELDLDFVDFSKYLDDYYCKKIDPL